MIFTFKKVPYSRLIGLLLLVPVIISLSCTSAYHGPPRFSYENRVGVGSDRNLFSTDEPVLNQQTSNPLKSDIITTINERDYVLRRTANNLWHLVEKPTEDKSSKSAINAGCCGAEKNRNDSTFCYNAINTFCEISEILVNLTGFNPIVRACLVAGLKYLKPLLYRMCSRVDNNAAPSPFPANRT